MQLTLSNSGSSKVTVSVDGVAQTLDSAQSLVVGKSSTIQVSDIIDTSSASSTGNKSGIGLDYEP
jgi:hypothetical protein